MKESTKLILMYAGSAVVGNMLLASPVAGATADFPKVAAGGEGAVALGGAYGAWKLKGKKRVASAILGGLGAGLLVNSIQSGLLTAPAPKPGGATPQSMPKTGPGSTLPTIGSGSGAIPVPILSASTVGGFASASGNVPPGAAIPAPNRPPTPAEQLAYDQAVAHEQAVQAAAEQQWNQQNPTPGGALPTVPEDSGEGGGIFDWITGQSGAAARLQSGAPRRAGFGGMAASFRK